MPNGSHSDGNSAEWRAIDKNRDDIARLHEADAVRRSEFNTLAAGQKELEHAFAEFQAEVKHEVRTGVATVNQRLDKWVSSLKWAIALIVPAATAAITLWLSNLGGP